MLIKKNTIPFELQLKVNGFFNINISVKISFMEHWILYYMKDGVLYFFDFSGQPLNIYGIAIESVFTSYTSDKVKVFNFPLVDDYE